MRLLNSHSQIASPCEICVPYVVKSSWKLLKSLGRIRKICRHYNAPLPAVYPSLVLRRPARRHLDRLTETILNREGKRTLVIKDPRHASHVARIEKLYRNRKPRYILLYRDARSVAYSFHHTLKRSLERGFRVWQESVNGMLACERSFPDRCLPVTFEDLLTDPHGTMRKVTEFLGHEYETSMLDYGRHAHADDTLNLWRNKRLITSVSAGVINQNQQSSWRDDAELIGAYNARSEIIALNEQVEHRGSDDDHHRTSASRKQLEVSWRPSSSPESTRI